MAQALAFSGFCSKRGLLFLLCPWKVSVAQVPGLRSGTRTRLQRSSISLCGNGQEHEQIRINPALCWKRKHSSPSVASYPLRRIHQESGFPKSGQDRMRVKL